MVVAKGAAKDNLPVATDADGVLFAEMSNPFYYPDSVDGSPVPAFAGGLSSRVAYAEHLQPKRQDSNGRVEST